MLMTLSKSRASVQQQEQQMSPSAVLQTRLLTPHPGPDPGSSQNLLLDQTLVHPKHLLDQTVVHPDTPPPGPDPGSSEHPSWTRPWFIINTSSWTRPWFIPNTSSWTRPWFIPNTSSWTRPLFHSKHLLLDQTLVYSTHLLMDQTLHQTSPSISTSHHRHCALLVTMRGRLLLVADS
ncbi:hypothetical protein D4764_05G0013100 [Takifugu flavidus]|uniref:Uncharacterized protein n=1 Tax=Takifugu flavidus TaxID=433684 RepID=A0A5C6N606_9TELE|nr:hypothetical protein D4764_05G0013100 [Takifugu flavidus]